MSEKKGCNVSERAKGILDKGLLSREKAEPWFDLRYSQLESHRLNTAITYVCTSV